jgi:hypothetical protein
MSFALGKQWTLSDQCLVGAQLIAQEAGLSSSRIQVAQAEAEIAAARGNYSVAAAHAESVLMDFDQQLSAEMRSQLYGLLVICYQKISRLDDLLSVKKKKLALSEGRYQSGLAAAMVILDLKTSLRQILA